MRNVVESYSKNSNFWEENPQLAVINPFKTLMKDDKSKGKVESSNLMWAIALINHPKSDLYYVENKEFVIAKDMLGLKESSIDKFWDNNKHLVDAFTGACLSQAERSLVDWYGYMRKRDIYLKNTEYYFDQYKTDNNGDNIVSKTGQFVTEKGTAEQLDKAWGASKSMWADYEKIIKTVSEEEVVVKNKREKSSTAKGEI